MHFLAEFRAMYRNENPKARAADVSKAASTKWKAMGEEDKETYVIMSNEDKDRYSRELKEYHVRELGYDKKEEKLRPLGAFVFFLHHFKKQRPADEKVNMVALSREAGAVWRKMSDEEKNPFRVLSERNKKDFYKHKKEVKAIEYRRHGKEGGYRQSKRARENVVMGQRGQPRMDVGSSAAAPSAALGAGRVRKRSKDREINHTLISNRIETILEPAVGWPSFYAKQ